MSATHAIVSAMIIPKSTVVDPIKLINRRILDLLRLKERILALVRRRPLDATMEPSAFATKEHKLAALKEMSAHKDFPLKFISPAEMERNYTVQRDLIVIAITIPKSTVIAPIEKKNQPLHKPQSKFEPLKQALHKSAQLLLSTAMVNPERVIKE